MGLDNIPKNYACKNQGVAIMTEDDRIDCAATIEAGKCPHSIRKNSDPLIKDAIIPLGIIGTNCWYRGKYGTYLLEQMVNYNPSFPFDENTLYGSALDEDQEGLSAKACLHVSEGMLEFADEWSEYVKTESEVSGDSSKEKDLINDWVYLAWWLKFVGEECDGMVSWY